MPLYKSSSIIHLKDFQKTSKRDKDLTVFERNQQKKGGKTCTFQKKDLSLHPTESTTASLLFGECSVPGWNFFYICMKYNKQPLDIPDLLAMLKARGLTIGDEQQAGRLLGLVSYFRLANYLRPMEADKETHQYKPDSSFENAVALYRFDAALREIVFRAISNIEIALRSKMIHHFSLKYGAFWFTNMSICNDEHLFLENLNAVDREVRRSKEDYIKEHFSKS